MVMRCMVTRPGCPMASLAAWLLWSGCSSPTAPRFDTELEVQAETVWVNRSPNEVRILVPIIVRNQVRRSLYVTPCGHALQLETSSRWVTVWFSPCQLGTLYSLELSPGESTILMLSARTAIASESWPNGAVAGVYRAVLSLTSVPLNMGGIMPTPVAPNSRTTQPFPVRVRTIVF